MSLITRIMYSFSNNRTDMQQNDPIIVNQDWINLLLSVVHWNILGKLCSVRWEDRNISETSFCYFSQLTSGFSNRVHFNQMRLKSACFSSCPNIGTGQIISLLWSTLTRDGVECWLGTLHLNLLNVLTKAQNGISLWVAATNSLCAGFFM